MISRTAACSCGQLRIVTRGEPLRISVCHCLACQKRTGSTFGYQARFARDNVTIEGRATRYTRIADSGQSLTYSFCPDCGATVHYQQDHLPDIVAVPVGGFADPQFPAPRFSVYESRMHRWFRLDGDMEHHE